MYFSDPTRVARFADWLEEDLVHHASILQSRNIANTNLSIVADYQSSRISSPIAPVSIPSTIAGVMKLLHFLILTFNSN